MTMRARVNQKLYFARLVLDQAERVDDPNARTALLQSALFHLATAYRFYLGEIAASYRLTLRADSARAALQQIPDNSSPELAELAILEQSGQWPARLLAACNEACEPMSAPPAAVSPTTIAMADITEIVDIQTCRNWLAALQALLDAQREQLQEW